MKELTCILPLLSSPLLKELADGLRGCSMVDRVLYVSSASWAEDSKDLIHGHPHSTRTLKEMVLRTRTPYLMILDVQDGIPLPRPHGLERMLDVARDTGSVMVYSDYRVQEGGQKAATAHPLIDLQKGSVRDDFKLGSVLIIKTSAAREVLMAQKEDYRWAGLYSLRLALSRTGTITHIPEMLYTEVREREEDGGERQFDYVNPRNREVQIEMEKAVTRHLEAIGALLRPIRNRVEDTGEAYPLEASVLIPVRNRHQTIRDAIQSALQQEAPFRFNVLVIDNHSTDGTSEVIREMAARDDRIIHIIPSEMDLGIGGCWNRGILDSRCGRYVIQLDSDDVYSGPGTLQRIVEKFRKDGCAAVVGSYTLTDLSLRILSPGLIDHREWTDENGMNNALRVNGFGAPRAFLTRIARECLLPDVSYGEDYALMLRISRHYPISRIYESLYLCRRWGGNSDASLDISAQNAHNRYKDTLRTLEIEARIRENQQERRK